MSEGLAKDILRRQAAIFKNIEQESIDVYIFLHREAQKGDVAQDNVFQFVFRSFYRLDSAGLGPKIKKKYFRLLGKKCQDLKIILEKLHEIKTLRNLNTVQFSFATKLLHTLDPRNPIYDSKVALATHIHTGGNTPESRIQSCMEKYEELRQIHATLLKNVGIQRVISRFRNKFKVSSQVIPNVKIVDFLLWSLGSLRERR